MSIIATLINKTIGWRWRPRTIRRPGQALVYLKRWYLSKMPTMPNGSFPFDRLGTPKPGLIGDDSSYSLFLHRFGLDDEDDPHNHPWTWAVSFIFSGGYIEERYDPTTGKLEYFPRPAPCINFITHKDYHRVILVDGKPAWSLFLTGRQVSSWGFIDRKTRKWIHWEKYFQKSKNDVHKVV